MDFRSGLEAVTAADGRDAQVQAGVLRMTADVDYIFGRFALHADLNELPRIGVVFTEVNAQSALSVIDVFHPLSPLLVAREDYALRGLGLGWTWA